ncbi:hypothetical protein [Paracoccus sp. SSK6]|uniref:hypothetical protein n=1 Tax=Paracoccus sp. SSK6 TaxID=3143131 RepID=UPI003219F0C5
MTSITDAGSTQLTRRPTFGSSGTADAVVPDIDARPILRRHASSLWGRAAIERDRLYAGIEAACAARGFETLVLKSGDEVHPAWVQWECWLQHSQFSERIKLTIAVEPRPHHRFELVYRVGIENRGQLPKVRLYGRLGDDALRKLVDGLIDGPGLPRLSEPQLRTNPLQFWRPRNRLVSLRSDPFSLLARLAIFAGIAFGLIIDPGSTLIQMVGNLQYGLREILAAISWELTAFLSDEGVITLGLLIGAVVLHARRRGRLSLVLLIVAGMLSFVFQPGLWFMEMWWALHTAAIGSIFGPLLDPISGLGWTGPFLLIVALIGLAAFRSQQTYLVYNEGRPLAEPRVLALGDYWHAVLPDIGSEADSARKHFLTRIREAAHPELAAWVERVATRGAEGKEEREQVVLSFRRALVFCQFHVYGRDLYIGWDAFLNRGRWAERQLARGVDRKTGERVVINIVDPSQELLTEYDVVDLNCAIEWAHSRMTELVRQIAAEHAIDQEIDFTIQRADRSGLVGPDEGRKGKKERGLSRLKRVD